MTNNLQLRGVTSAIVLAGTMLTLAAFLHPMSPIEIHAQEPKCRFFRETGRAVCGKFLTFWQRYGGIIVFGLPISNEFNEESSVDGQVYNVQYFERAVFELHPENKPPYDVQLSHVGTFQYRTKYPQANIAGNLPLYPNGTYINVEESEGMRVSTFETADRPENVRAFYKDALVKVGWRLSIDKPDALRFGYDTDPSYAPCPENPNCPGGTVYEVYIEMKAAGRGKTLVKVYFKETGPR